MMTTETWRRSGRALLLAAALASPLATLADDGEPAAESWAVHGQATGTLQGHPHYASPYSGGNSLDPKAQRNETADLTLALGFAPWSGAAIWIDGELDQGFGLSNTLGIAGFPSGEAYKVGRHRPYPRLPRAVLQQTFALGDDSEAVAADFNQLAGTRPVDRIVLTLGKLAVPDLFDANRYAHDPRGDFLNWSVVEMGSFDYAADAWGFTYGAAAEWSQGRWTLRTGLFDLSAIPNSPALETTPFRQYQLIGEIEERHRLGDADGALHLLWYDSRGRMGGYDAAIAAAAADGLPAPATAAVRAFHSKQGAGLDLEQAVTAEIGLFLRAGVSQGQYEAYEFTDINRTLSGGLSVDGRLWRRDGDRVGLALAENGMSRAGLRYLAAGGLGVLTGDGRLPHPGSERLAEFYYRLGLGDALALTVDGQYVENPAYNRDRGPIPLWGVRLHGQF